MSNIFCKQYLDSVKEVYFPYTREQLTQRPIFPTYVYDGGAFLFINDAFDAADSDVLLELIMSDKLFEYWTIDGKFDWCAIYKKWVKLGAGIEWEAHYWLNRMYILLPLAQQFSRTKNKVYSDKWYTLLTDWFDKNPYDPTQTANPQNRVWRDMQVAWRTINIVHSIFLFGDDDVFTAEQWDNIYSLVRLHSEHLYKESIIHAKEKNTGNHKLQIAIAAIMVGALYPESEHSAEYIEVGRQIVAENLKRDIRDDGVSVENAVSYAHFIVRLFLEAHLLLTYNGYESIPGLAESIADQCEYLYQFSSPDGKTMQIGDSYAMDAIADIEFINSIFPLDFERRKCPTVFNASQLAVLRNDSFDIHIDAMTPPEKGNGYTWHPHYGKPTFVAYMNGKPLVIDRGCPNYNRSDLYIPLYIESGHNVIACDELPHAKGSGLAPTDVVIDISITDYSLEYEHQSVTVQNNISSHDGSVSYKWTRKFELFGDRLDITDTVSASVPLHFTSYMYIPGILNLSCKLTPVMPSQLMKCDECKLDIRFDETKQTITTDSPFIFEVRPYINDKNKVDYCNAITRSFFTDSFTERTSFVISQ